MLILCLTNKVLKEFGKEKPALAEVSEDVSSINEWYVNLFYLNRRKCLMFTNAGALFSFVAAGVSRKDIQNLPELFCKALSRALFYEEFTAGQIQEIMKRLDQITIAKTSNRSVLSSMNQMIFEYEYMAGKYAHLGDEGMITANRKLNKMLRGAIGEGRHDYGVPIERFTEMVTGKKAERIEKAQNFGAQKQLAYIFTAQMTQYADGENIMRQVAVSGNKNLLHLAQVILNAFDFDCDHCFGFYGNIHKHPGREQTEIYEAFVDADVEPTNDLAKSVERTKIAVVFKDIGKKMLFMFDYGQDWRFIVELKEIQEGLSEKLPRVLNSIGVAPPQYPPLEEE